MKLSMIGFLSGFLLVSSLSLFAAGTQETENKMIIRVAEQVPNLITPGAESGSRSLESPGF
jgi:hypothetical protein